MTGPATTTVNVPAKPRGLWTRAKDFVEGPFLTIEARPHGFWAYADAATSRCGADGDPDALLARANCLNPDAPVGALIGKIGGSSGGVKDGTPFVVGGYCVFRVPDGGGPLYFTINDEYDGMANNAGSITVDFAETPSRATRKPQPDPPTCCALLARFTPAPATADASVTESNPADTQ
jgi:hypothetical protein